MGESVYGIGGKYYLGKRLYGNNEKDKNVSKKLSIATIVPTLCLISLMLLLGTTFALNGVRSIKDIFINKQSLENACYITQIFCSFVVMIGGIIGVWQYTLAKQTEKNQYHNNRIQKAIDLSAYYKDNILCYITFIHGVYKEAGILDILNEVKRTNMQNFDILELDKNFTTAQKNRITAIINSTRFLKIIVDNASIFSKEPLYNKIIVKDGDKFIETVEINQNKVMNYFGNNIICETLNNLEYFSLHFNYGLADIRTVYQSLHQTYLEIIHMLYYDISINNKQGTQRLYTNVIELFNAWKKIAEEQSMDEIKFSRGNIVKGSKVKTVE